LTATSSAEGISQLPERGALVVEAGVRVDGHRDADVRVADEFTDDVRRAARRRRCGDVVKVKADSG